MEVLNPLMNRIPEFLEMGKPINASEFPLQQADPNNLMIGTTPGTGSGILNNPLDQITAPGQIPDRYKEGFEEFYKQNPNDYMRFGGQAISFVTTPQGETIQFGDTGGATNFRRYLESIGETPLDNSLSQPGLKTDSVETGPIFAGRPILEELPNFMKRTPGLPPPSQMPPVGINNILGKIDEGIGAMNPYDNQLNFNDRSSLNTFVDNLINNRLKEFFGGIMGMLDV
jgi:hypothetical protein